MCLCKIAAKAPVELQMMIDLANQSPSPYAQGFLFTQISGHSPIEILKVLNISKLQDNFCIYWCEF